MIDDAIAKAGPKNSLAMIEAADALIHFKTKDLDKAKLLLDKAYALDPKNPEIQILYGDIYSERNNGTVAVVYYKKALVANPYSAAALINIGMVFKELKKPDSMHS